MATNTSVNDRLEAATLRARVIQSLRSQGFIVTGETIRLPEDLSKDETRILHRTAVEHRIRRSKKGLFRKEHQLIKRIASGHEVVPSKIQPRLVEVLPRSNEELLFRYATLHWSIPVSSGYGRRLRFIVVDDHNGKLMGLIGLGDPVFSLAPRDKWVGWTRGDRRQRLTNVMDAFVLGAVPPYSLLLCGKLIALLSASNTVRRTFKRKYKGTHSVIQQRVHDGRLVLITTASALGRSSIYNRLRFRERLVYKSVGFTKGSGEFHFANGLYHTLVAFAKENCAPTAKQSRWGTGFRNRREVVKKCLPLLGISSDWVYHGIEREAFVVPLARNSREFLCGTHEQPLWYDLSEADIFEHFRERWMLPRSAKDSRYVEWSRNRWRLWTNE